MISNKDFSTRIFQQGLKILVEKSLLKNPCWKFLFKNPCWKIRVVNPCCKSLLEIIVGNPCWKILVKKCLLKNPRIFQQGFSTRICNKDFSCSNKNVPTKMFHQKCSNKSCQQKCSNKNVPSKMFQQKCSNKSYQQKSSIKNVPKKMFQQKCSKAKMFQQLSSNKDLPSKMFQLVEKSLFQPCCKILPSKSLLKILVEQSKDVSTRKLPTRIFQQWFSSKDFSKRIYNKATRMFLTIISNKDLPTRILVGTRIVEQILVEQLFPTRIFQQAFFNKDFLSLLTNPCWKILVGNHCWKSLLKNPGWKILVQKSLLKILVGNPCWKIQGFFNKDFSTRNYNKDLQQGFLMFQQKCANKNVPTKMLPTKMFQQKCFNKNFPTKMFQKQCSNKGCSIKNVPTRIFQQKFFNKNLPLKMLNKNPSIEKSYQQKSFQQKLPTNPGSNKDFSRILVEQGFTTRQQGFVTKISNKDFSTRIFQSSWIILVKKWIPCWKIQGFFNKDFTTMIFNKNVQPTKMFHQKSNKNVPTKMFHQKCTNKNVPTKVANKNLPTRIFQQGFTTRQQGFPRMISNKDFSTRIFPTRIFNPCWKILVEKSLLKNAC